MASTLFAGAVWIVLILANILIIEKAQADSILYFAIEPHDIVVQRRSQLLWNCSVSTRTIDYVEEAASSSSVSSSVSTSGSSSNSGVNITWLKNGEVVSDARHVVLPSGALRIRRVKSRTDEGIYQCVAKAHSGIIISRNASLQTAYLDKQFSALPQDVSVEEGGVARLDCFITGLPSPDISWLQNTQPLPQDSRYLILPSGVLQIENVVASDAGQYQCVAKNIAKIRTSSAATLTILPQGESSLYIEAGPSDQIVEVGSDVVLECLLSGQPRPANPWTRRDDAELPTSRMSILGAGNLRIHDVQVKDAGVYICSITETDKVQANLVVHVPPYVVTSPKNIRLPVAHTIRINCELGGEPPPVMSWLKNGHTVSPDGRINIKPTELVISQSTPQDSGYYQCFGRSMAGQVHAEAYLYVYPNKKAPHAPRGLQAQCVDSTKIHLSWVGVTPQPNTKIIAYTVHYKITQRGSEYQNVVEGTEKIIENLKPNTNYTFYVVAYSQEGASEHSHNVTEKTDEDVPVVAPTVHVLPRGTTTLEVEWDPLLPSQARGVVTKYSVRYRLHGGHSEYMQEVPGHRYKDLLSDLVPNQKYDVRVLAGTKVGYPSLDDQDWPWATQITNPNSNLGLPDPPMMQVQALNSTAIQVTWEEPRVAGATSDDDAIQGYKLNCVEGTNEKIMIFVRDQHSHIITRLESNQMYEVSLRAFNKRGDGEVSIRNVFTLPKSILDGPNGRLPPPPPKRIHADPVNTTSIKLSWKRPPTEMSIVRYTVRYKPVMEQGGREITNTSAAHHISTSEMFVVISHLDPFTEYIFQVSSHASAIDGIWGPEVRCRTKEGLPSAPVNLRGQVDGPSRVKLTWQPPTEKNGVIIQYVIFYSPGPSAPKVEWQQKHQNGSSTHAMVDDLEADEVYYFKMAAATRAGTGPFTRTLEVYTNGNMQRFSPGEGPKVGGSERDKGIIVGVSIGGSCIIICALIVLLRNRCFPPQSPNADPNSSYQSNGCVYIGSNGNGLIGHACPHGQCTFHEMDSGRPMLTHLHENETSDSKGGSYNLNGHNGHVNGVLQSNGLQATCTANGHVKHVLIPREYKHSGSEDCSQMPHHCFLHSQDGSSNHSSRVGNGPTKSLPKLSSLEHIDLDDHHDCASSTSCHSNCCHDNGSHCSSMTSSPCGGVNMPTARGFSPCMECHCASHHPQHLHNPPPHICHHHSGSHGDSVGAGHAETAFMGTDVPSVRGPTSACPPPQQITQHQPLEDSVVMEPGEGDTSCAPLLEAQMHSAPPDSLPEEDSPCPTTVSASVEDACPVPNGGAAVQRESRGETETCGSADCAALSRPQGGSSVSAEEASISQVDQLQPQQQQQTRLPVVSINSVDSHTVPMSQVSKGSNSISSASKLPAHSRPVAVGT